MKAAEKDDPPPPPSVDPPRKRGRPKKGEERPKEPTRLQRQMSQGIKEMLAELPTDCDVGTKNNSKGYKQSWTGYKLHIDVVDGQIPVCCLLTSASVHDMASAWCSAFKSALARKLRVDHGNMAEGPAVFDDLRGIIGRVHDVVQISDPLPGDGHEPDGDLARWNLVRLEGNI